jgi:hypothetical protein
VNPGDFRNCRSANFRSPSIFVTRFVTTAVFDRSLTR